MKIKFGHIALRPITAEDYPFIQAVYASTRTDEMALTGWNAEQIDSFLSMQFELQHKQYMANYRGATFDVIMHKTTPIGRLYVDRRPSEIRIIDIALLPEYRQRGIGAKLMKTLLSEADDKRLEVSLHVERTNPVMGFYQNLGFKVAGEVGVYYLMRRSARL